MSDNADYEKTGEQLNQKFDDLESQIEEIAESGGGDGGGEVSNEIAVQVQVDYEELAATLSEHLQDGRTDEEIVQLIQEHDTGLSEEDTRELIEEYGGSSDGLTEEDVRSIVEESDVGNGHPPGFHIQELNTSDLPTDHNYYVLLGKRNHDETHIRINGTLRGYRGRSEAYTNDAIDLLATANDEQEWGLTHTKLSPSAKAPETQFVTVERDGETYVALESSVDNYRNYNGQLVFQGLLYNASLEVCDEDDVSNVQPVPEGMLRGSMVHDRPGTSDGSGGDGGGLDDGTRQRLNELLDQLDASIGSLAFPARKVGPTGLKDADEFHTNPLWGIHFEAGHDFHIGEADIQSLASGRFMAQLWRYEAGELVELLDETEIAANSNRQTVNLDLHGTAGECFLTRAIPESREELGDDERSDVHEDAFRPEVEPVSLRRRESWDGWENHSDDDLHFYGGDNPVFGDNDYYYYFYNLHIAANENAHL